VGSAAPGRHTGRRRDREAPCARRDVTPAGHQNLPGAAAPTGVGPVGLVLCDATR